MLLGLDCLLLLYSSLNILPLYALLQPVGSHCPKQVRLLCCVRCARTRACMRACLGGWAGCIVGRAVFEGLGQTGFAPCTLPHAPGRGGAALRREAGRGVQASRRSATNKHVAGTGLGRIVRGAIWGGPLRMTV